jgi:hypothetical protein
MHRFVLTAALVAAFVSVTATWALAADPGNSDAAHACLQSGYASLVGGTIALPNTSVTFANAGGCASYAAHGDTLWQFQSTSSFRIDATNPEWQDTGISVPANAAVVIDRQRRRRHVRQEHSQPQLLRRRFDVHLPRHLPREHELVLGHRQSRLGRSVRGLRSRRVDPPVGRGCGAGRAPARVQRPEERIERLVPAALGVLRRRRLLHVDDHALLAGQLREQREGPGRRAPGPSPRHAPQAPVAPQAGSLQ